MRALTHDDYKVGWITVLHMEMAAAMAMFDERHVSLPKPPSDPNTYTLGRIGDHNVVLACLPAGQTGTTPAATVAAHMSRTFTSLRFGLLVGIGGGIPTGKHVIRLGDVVVSKPSAGRGGVVQYDFGNVVQGGELEPSSSLNAPPPVLGTAVNTLRSLHEADNQSFAQYFSQIPKLMKPEFICPGADYDLLFEANYHHVKGGKLCERCDKNRLIDRGLRNSPGPQVHYGNIGSGNEVMQDPATRDHLAEKFKLLCFEMEAAGVNDFPCVVIRGISDYADSHKNDRWKYYASAAAAAYAKQLLSLVKTDEVVSTTPIPPTPLSCYMFSNHLFPMSSVSLGRVVVSMSTPWQDFCPYPLQIANEDVFVTTEPRMHEILQRCEGSTIYAKLSKLLLSLTGIPLNGFHSAPEKTYFLSNPAYYFRKLCLERPVQTWFETTLKYAWNTYMVVAIHTIQTSSTTLCSGDGESRPTMPAIIEEKVFAVQYRKVKFTWFNWLWSQNVKEAYLEGHCRWTVTNSGRDDGSVNEDVEAELQNSVTAEEVAEEGEVFANGDLLIILEP